MCIRSASSPSTVLWAFHTIQPSSYSWNQLSHSPGLQAGHTDCAFKFISRCLLTLKCNNRTAVEIRTRCTFIICETPDEIRTTTIFVEYVCYMLNIMYRWGPIVALSGTRVSVTFMLCTCASYWAVRVVSMEFLDGPYKLRTGHTDRTGRCMNHAPARV